MLAGRAAEVERLLRAVDDRALLLVCGPPGIGKTALIEELLERRPAVRVGHSLPALADRAHHPLIHATSLPLQGMESAAALRLIRNELDPATVLVLEDLQWADPGTLEVMVGLLGHVAVIGTVQSGSDVARRALRLVESVGADVLELGPLDAHSMVELVAALRPDLLIGEQRQIADAANGVPLVASATAMSVDRVRGEVVEGTLAIEALLARQRPDDRVTIAILDGARAPVPAEQLAPVEALVQAGLVRHLPDGRVELVHRFFAHPEVLQLDEAQQRDAWSRLAELEGTTPTVRAECRLRCGDPAAALDDALRAADGPLARAEQAAALRVAAEASRALRTASNGSCPDDTEHAELLLRAATAANDVFDSPQALGLLDELAGLDVDPTHAAGVAVELLRAVIAAGDRARGAELLDRTATLLDGAGGADAARARSLRVMVANWSGVSNRGELRELVAAQVAAARSGVERSDAALLRGMVAYGSSGLDAAEWFEIARKEASVEQALHSEFEASRNLIMVRIAFGHHDVARQLASDCEDRATAAGEVGWAIEFRTLDVLSRFYDDADQADAIAWLSSVRTAPVRFETRAYATAARATILADQGAARRSAEVLAEWTRPEVLEDLEPFLQGVISWGAIQRAWIVGDLHEAIRIGRWVDDHVPPGYPSVAGTQVVWRWAELEAGEPLTAPYPTGGALNCAALEAEAIELLATGDHGVAAERFLAAAESWRPILWRCALRSRWGAGHALVLAGEHERARQVLEAVDAELDRSGSPALRPRVDAALRAAGARRPRVVVAAGGGSSITARETEVLQLVAEGHSSASVARRLGIGVDTVNGHVRSAVRKLGARSRIEAAAMVGLAGT